MKTKVTKPKSSTAAPVAVIIADLHFNLANLEPATAALKAASARADSLDVPLVIAGDLLDGKAIIRAEVANRLIEILRSRPDSQRVILLRGNHDMINEKGQEHALHFLEGYTDVVSSPVQLLDAWFVPYYSIGDNLKAFLEGIKPGSRIIAHQGVQSAFMGAYVQDKSSLPPEAFKDFRVISGHYHLAQDIKCGPARKNAVGLFSYVGTPFTMSFAEANDGPKGFQILKSDGTLEQVVLNLRKHIIVERRIDNVLTPIPGLNPGDLLWLKVTGPYSELEKLRKHQIGQKLLGHANFKFDKIPTEGADVVQAGKPLTGAELLDKMIDEMEETAEQKKFLKECWREALDEAT